MSQMASRLGIIILVLLLALHARRGAGGPIASSTDAWLAGPQAAAQEGDELDAPQEFDELDAPQEFDELDAVAESDEFEAVEEAAQEVEDAEPVGGVAATGSAPSNAGNYGDHTNISVNSRTLELTVDSELVHLAGITADMDLSIALSFSSSGALSDYESNTRVFGLPYGWAYNISYVVNNGFYPSVHVDGAQSYIAGTWGTTFTPAGGSAQTIQTGLLQYNRADTNYRSDSGTVVVDGITSARVLANVNGVSQYFSASGLLLARRDRFGNTIEYAYNQNTTPQNARLKWIVDSWGNTTTFTYGVDASNAPQVTLTMPDGRTVSFVTPNQYTVSKIIDPAGLVTSLTWSSRPCARGQSVLTGLTSPAGSFTTVSYDCMKVCTTRASGSICTTTTTWPVVKKLTVCPNNASGMPCPNGSPDQDFITTEYAFGTQNNSSGYPKYSPYQSNSKFNDALMASNDSTFTYSTRVTQRRAGGSIAHQTENTYNSLHLLTETTTSVASQRNGTLMPSKKTSYCYSLTSGTPARGCPAVNVNYQSLPANYQSPVLTGTCVYPVDDPCDGCAQGTARVSVAHNTFDSFGQVVNTKQYYGTAQSGVTTSCDRAVRLDPGPLKMVRDEYMAYDTPSSVDQSGYLDLGSDATHHGLMKAHQTFSYAEPQDGTAAVHGVAAQSDTPLMVQLTCNTIGSGGTAVSDTTTGLLATSAATPTTMGVISACASPSFDSSVAPPKTNRFAYDSAGRVVSQITQWASGVTAPMGSVSSTSDTLAYAMTGAEADEEACGTDGGGVLQTTLTDSQGHTTQSRECTRNGFPLSTTDALGRKTTYRHDQQGMTTQIVHPNGTAVSHQYHYTCPVAQDGRTPTCPSSMTPCPYDNHSPPRNCTVQTVHAGADPDTGAANASYADGVMQVAIKDGLGRQVELHDNLGGQPGAGYGAMQRRSSTTYDDLGLATRATAEIGAGNPLVYAETTAYDAKLRPKLVCAARGFAQQMVYDDVKQQTLTLENGLQTAQTAHNDAHQPTTTIDCPRAAAGVTSASGDCPTVAASPNRTTCSGNGYYAQTLHDGSGVLRSMVARGSGAEAGASVASIQGVPKLSADLMQYGYTTSSRPASTSGGGATVAATGALSATSSQVRDLQGKPLRTNLSVTDASNTTTTFTSDTYAHNDLGELVSATSPLSQSATTLRETYAYNANRQLTQRTNFAGTTFNSYYDTLDRLTRYCHPGTSGGSEGETYTYDAITGSVLQVTHFTNPGGCRSCSGGGSCPDDTATASISYTYTRFGEIASKTYSDGTVLEWAYDAYQRPSCFADAMATASGHHCPPSPTDDGFAPAADTLLTWYTYWPDGDPYRRGLPMSMCRGLPDGGGGAQLRCLDTDYYTSTDKGGSCDASLANAQGAFAGATKTTTMCADGSCLLGTGTRVYQTTHLYDAHGRSCSVESRNALGEVILRQTYGYDQYNNVVEETSASDLDPSAGSNYRLTYGYDGMLRLTSATRYDPAGAFLESIAYTYDAAANILQKVETFPGQPPPQPTGGVFPPETPTSAPTPTATRTRRSTGGGCAIVWPPD
jgi:YD repeat-containing protein